MDKISTFATRPSTGSQVFVEVPNGTPNAVSAPPQFGDSWDSLSPDPNISQLEVEEVHASQLNRDARFRKFSIVYKFNSGMIPDVNGEEVQTFDESTGFTATPKRMSASAVSTKLDDGENVPLNRGI